MGESNNPEVPIALNIVALTADDALLELEERVGLLIRTGRTDCLLHFVVNGGMSPVDLLSLARCFGSGVRLASVTLTAAVALDKCLDCEEYNLRRVEEAANVRVGQPFGCSEGSVLYCCKTCGDYWINHCQVDPDAGSSSEWERLGSQPPSLGTDHGGS